MTKKKLKIAVLFGGKSAEHEVSVMSARNIIQALNKDKYSITPIKISKEGKFNLESLRKFDLIFPVLHGPFGEDGSIQGVFKVLGIPFVGAGVLGSAVGMDKDVMKRLLKEAGVPICKFITIKSDEDINFEKTKRLLRLPIFIKPANMGSSVGVSKVRNKEEYGKAIKEAFKYDSKIILEEFVEGKEIECSVLGNDDPKASLPGEIVANQEFYSYNAKYIDDGYKIIIPAPVPAKVNKRIRELAVKTYQTLNCEGLARVDFFVKQNNEIFVNEINTMPGFTNISMYPKLWEASGIKQTELLDKLIALAIDRFKKEQSLKTTIR